MTDREDKTPEPEQPTEQEEEQEQVASEHGTPTSQQEGASPSSSALTVASPTVASPTPTIEREESSSSEIAPLQETTSEDIANFYSGQVRLHVQMHL